MMKSTWHEYSAAKNNNYIKMTVEINSTSQINNTLLLREAMGKGECGRTPCTSELSLYLPLAVSKIIS